jgi:transposase InsO family protein
MSRNNIGWGAPATARLLPRACYRAPATARLLPRACIYGERFRDRVKSLGIEEVLTAPRSPWQSPYVERLIGSIRRECLTHVIIVNERHLRRQLKSYSTYYHEARTHLSLNKQCPVPRSIQDPDQGNIVAIPHLGGLHHEYRRAA